MKRRNFLKWLVAIPAVFVASKLPVFEPIKKYTFPPNVNVEWCINGKWYKYDRKLKRTISITTDSTDNIEEFIKS